MKKLLFLLCPVFMFTSCLTMQPQTREEYEKGSQNYWVQEYVQVSGKWVKNGSPYIAPDTLKIFKIWKQK